MARAARLHRRHANECAALEVPGRLREPILRIAKAKDRQAFVRAKAPRHERRGQERTDTAEQPAPVDRQSHARFVPATSAPHACEGAAVCGNKRSMHQDASTTRGERIRAILAVLAKHGLAVAGAELRFRGDGEGAERIARELREACEELGTTFIKLAQLLSTRGDLLPDAFCSELAKLQDSVPPIDTAIVIDAIEAELGASPFQLFESFEIEPIACASIGQVHAARLLDGRSAIVKVRKPGVRAQVEQDLEILAQFSSSAEKYVPDLAGYDVPGLVAEFSDMLRAELSYTREARNVDAFRALFDEENDGIELPAVVREYSTDRVLTLTYVEGEKVTELMSLQTAVRPQVARRIARFVLEPAFTQGIFHADPHPGNIVIRTDGTIGVFDFGMVGRFGDEQRRKLTETFVALDSRDVQRLTDRLIDLGPPERPVDRVAFASDLSRLVERYMSDSLERARMGAALLEILDLVREYELRMPSPVAMFFKAIAMAESIIVEVAPETSLQSFIDPIAANVSKARLNPKAWAERAQVAAMETAELGIELPRRADRVLADIERGNLRVWTRIEDADPLLSRIERIAERANATMLASACIVGITILLAFYHPRGWQGVVGWIFWIAVVVAVLWVFRTAWATFRRRS